MNADGAYTAHAPLFSDAHFPAHVSSIDGRHHDDGASAAPPCSCGAEAKLCTVSKDGPSQGRHFWGCAAETGAARCGFFKWCRQPPHAAQDSALIWLRLRPEAGYVVVGGDGFRPESVRQGSVGDCWFLAALAVVASKPELIAHLLIDQTASVEGKYRVRLFIDGAWRPFEIDDSFPHRPAEAQGKGPAKGKGPKGPVGPQIAFTKAAGRQVDRAQPSPDLTLTPTLTLKLNPNPYSNPSPNPNLNPNQLWPSLVEKAYAKAHGCYHAISGGWVAEALFDLTGCPTETLWLQEGG